MENKNFKLSFDIDTELAKSSLEELKVWLELLKEQIAKGNFGQETFNTLANSIANAGEKIKDYERSIEDAVNSTKTVEKVTLLSNSFLDLKRGINDLDEVLQSSEFGSKEFLKAAAQIGEYNRELENAEKLVKLASSATPQLDVMVNVTENLQSGFEGAQAAAELFGIESNKIASIIDKVSKTQTVLNSLQKASETLFSKNTEIISKGAQAKDKLANSIGSATKSFKLFNKAMSANVIGAIITAVATLAAYWQDIRETLRFTSSEQKSQLKSSEDSVAAEEAKLKALENQDNIKREQGISEKEILKSKLRQTDEVIKAATINLENQRTTLKAQVEAEKRNKSITKGILDFFTINITMVLGLIDKAGSVFGKDFGLVEKFNNFKDTVASKFFNPEEVQKKGDEAIKASQEKILALENQASRHALAIKQIDRKAYEDWKRKLKHDIENELKLRKEKNTLTEEFELKALEEFRKHKIVSEIEFKLKKQKIEEKYDKLDKERIEKAAANILKIEKEGLQKVLDIQNEIYDKKLHAEKLKLAKGEITQREFAKESLKIETERLQKLKEAQDQYHGQSIEDIQKHFKDEKEELDRKRAEKIISEDDYYKQLATLNATSKATNKDLLETQASEDVALRTTINENIIAVETAATAERNRIAAAELAFKKRLQEDTLNLATALGGLLQKQGEKQNKIQKGVALVKIGIDTAKAISSAIANANSATADNVATGGIAGIAKFIAISAQILTAAAKAKSVLSSGQGSAGGGAAPTPSAPSVAAPQINAPRIARTPIVNRQNTPEPIKVFVSEADIRNTSKKVEVIESQSEVV